MADDAGAQPRPWRDPPRPHLPLPLEVTEASAGAGDAPEGVASRRARLRRVLRRDGGWTRVRTDLDQTGWIPSRALCGPA